MRIYADEFKRTKDYTTYMNDIERMAELMRLQRVFEELDGNQAMLETRAAMIGEKIVVLQCDVMTTLAAHGLEPDQVDEA